MSMLEQQLKAPPELKKVAEFLRGSGSGIKIRVGALGGKRIDYFKGKSAIKALLSPAFAKQKNVPKITTEDEAKTVLQAINAFAFFLRVQRGGHISSKSASPAAAGGGTKPPRSLQIIPEQTFQPDEYYAWFYEGSQWTTYAGGVLMVLIMLAGVMFPLWPPVMRLGVWYLSMGMLGLIGLFFAIAIVRLIFYIITVIVASPGIWIFPQLFADVGFVDSFIPLWEWDIPKKKGKKKKGDKEGKSEKKGKSKAAAPAPTGSSNGGGAYIEEVVEDDAQAPQSQPQRRTRSAMVEEVEDEDA
ncbi:endoplasmic reticulum receptor [Coprinopsis cinerea okayama7|uniref:Translocation protein SEC62 n=1 Tax=Coprinopsis cinerea (strain Okayama-7 / 130 / ATCC MYA-4618 / FGSC 9003) TaxID=240176 RepID=A8NCI1_COPC7|nr:endoplasmic reticulum receptor [Coprinopsis cinerea okayama7\|eukprot:XP_001832525.1 endoplasmic reticulum receptor [Coprinopsis cinerea okayama7\